MRSRSGCSAMTATTKPATPLPWSTGPVMANDSFPLHGRIDAVGNVARGRDAAYIVHACNAYPELVAALRSSERQLSTLGSAFAQDVRALLAKLGESA
jgi:hypothetical protein